jgi:hypothetical protein
VKTVIELRVPQNWWNLLTDLSAISFSRRSVLREVLIYFSVLHEKKLGVLDKRSIKKHNQLAVKDFKFANNGLLVIIEPEGSSHNKEMQHSALSLSLLFVT